MNKKLSLYQALYILCFLFGICGLLCLLLCIKNIPIFFRYMLGISSLVFLLLALKLLNITRVKVLKQKENIKQKEDILTWFLKIFSAQLIDDDMLLMLPDKQRLSEKEKRLVYMKNVIEKTYGALDETLLTECLDELYQILFL